MPGKVKVKILAGRNLPVMDRSSDTTDAYVEIKLGNTTQKTDVFRKSLNPQWNSEWFIFEADDAELQDEPLQIRLMDYDTYSANDAIGKVYLDLNPLLVPPGLLGRGNVWSEACAVQPPGGTILSGWLPVYDTMHGMRGEVSVIVKMELFSDVNKFRQSSCGVHFFSTPSTPCGFKIQSIQGFVKELVVNDDPEYQWIDKIRTPRASNEARQTLFSQLSGEVRRKIGLKVLELGGNAVIGYQQTFDLEGVTGLVVRGIGTSVTLVRSHTDGMASVTTNNLLKDTHASGRDIRSRLHQSEPVLHIDMFSAVEKTQPCLLRMHSLPVHDGYANAAHSVSSAVKAVVPVPFLKGPRRKVSLSNLFANKPSLKMKVHHRSRDTRQNADAFIAEPKGVILSSPMIPLVRVRSRSAPFSEMSPIQESPHQGSQDNVTINISPPTASPTQLYNTGADLFLYPESATTVDVRFTLNEPVNEPFELPEEPVTICFVGGSSDDSDFELQFQPSGLEINNDNDANSPVLNATHPHPTVDEPVFPYPNRSPRSSAPVQLMDVVHKSANVTGHSPANPAGQPTPGSRPSPCIRRSSDSEISVTPRPSSLSDSVGSSSGMMSSANRPYRQGSVPVPVNQTYSTTSGPEAVNLDVLEYPFLTMKTYPPGFVVHIGGTVSARSVKLLDRINNSEEPETRDNWWTEIRMEVRSHARSLGCTVILGYEEHTSICDEVCVLSAAGTAAIVKLQSSEPSEAAKEADQQYRKDSGNTKQDERKQVAEEQSKLTNPLCHVAHIPYNKANIPFPIKLSKCSVCRKGKVPDVLIATIEPPAGIGVTGRGCLVQARLCRPKRDESRGDQQAKEVSDGLPFLEYELHRQLINKLRIKGMNAIFALKVQVSVGERHMVGVATGTAVFLSALPTPSLPLPSNSNIAAKQSKRSRVQKMLVEAHTASKDHYGLNCKVPAKVIEAEETKWADSSSSDEDVNNELDLSSGNKDACILEIDDAEDIDVIELLIDPQPPDGFDVVTTEAVPGLPIDSIHRSNLQAFNRVWKGKLPATHQARHFSRCFEMILRSIYFKLRKTRPCVITNLQFNVDLPEDDEIQITVLGTAVAIFSKTLIDPIHPFLATTAKGLAENDMIFHLEDDGGGLGGGGSSCGSSMGSTNAVSSESASHALMSRSQMHSTQGLPAPSTRTLNDKTKFYVQKERQPVDITTLIRLPGSRVERYLGHLNFFFIRESTSIREDGGLSGFMQSFITEVLAIVRAHASALGGNALVSYFMTQCVLLHNPHKNQGQCLINVGGDVVQAVRCVEKDS